ncbi:tRNA dimethylallyltransferase [Perilla frutescens var. hirtella]|uniref:tRNA dimethylallyltransferase n=1 Tax=Perilla frutescens var. hirtella TaxID=608512 RepID=A0AAD4PG94_PERFH|nr:tRNA dimethylallyltransferase [Perilla frutescens var. hirtella]
MAERFFLRPSPKPNRKFDECEAMSILSGPPSSGKTSLLFQFAFNSAAEGNAVVILCHRRSLETAPPFLSQGVDPSSDIFRRIQVKYVDDDEAIKNYFAAFHLHHTFPASIIVDNFGYFFDERNCRERYNNPRGRDLAMVRVLALCRNVISHANKSSRCEILLSDTHKGDTPRLLYIYKRWASCIYTIKGDGSGSFVLKKSYSGMANAKPTSSAKYSIALQYLVLEGLVEEADN